MLPLIALASIAASSAQIGSNSWDLTYRDGFCTVVRSGPLPADGAAITSISWDIVFNYFKVRIAAPASGVDWKAKGALTYETADGLLPVPAAHVSSRRLPGERYRIDVTLSREWAKSVSFAGLGLNTADGRKAVSPDGLTDAQNMLDTCRQQHLPEFDIDPAEVDYTLTRATPSPTPSTWFDASDLPRSQGKRALYTPFVIWRVDVDARPSHCQLVTGSGRPDLDKAICSSFMKRVRYLKPAIDRDGNPVASWDGRRIQINY